MACRLDGLGVRGTRPLAHNASPVKLRLVAPCAFVCPEALVQKLALSEWRCATVLVLDVHLC